MAVDQATQPRDDSYDGVVIGSGLGGVSAAALVAKHGQKVLLAERGDAPGGYAHAVERDRDGRQYLFAAATHVSPAGQMLGEFIQDPHLKAVLGSCWSYMGLPPSRLSCLHFAQLLNVIIDGSFYCKGSFQKLVDAFIYALERDGGELVVNNAVEKVLVDDGQVRGVVLAGGREIKAPVVESN